MKRVGLFLSLIVILLVILFFLWISPRYTVPVLTYHNINYENGSFFVSPENFAKQMEYIKKKGYEVISLDELVKSIKEKRPLKRNKVVITFDDGYRDNFEYAYPVLKKFGFPATIFIISDFIGREHAGEGKEFMGWNEVIVISEDRISIGSHTKTHFELGSFKDDQVALEELTGSRKKIEEKIGRPVEYFCYPSGVFSEKAKNLVIRAGYKGACTTNRGFAKFNRDNIGEISSVK